MRILPMVLLTAVLTNVSIDGNDEESSGRKQSAKKDRRQAIVQTKQAQSREMRRATPVVKEQVPARAGATQAPAVPPRAVRPTCDRDSKARAD